MRFTATGFTIGQNAQVNTGATAYHWVAFQAGCGTLKVGSYTGNGGTQAITGAGFQPEFVMVMSAGAARSLCSATRE